MTPLRRRRLPHTRNGMTKKFKLHRPGHERGDLKVYCTVGLYDDGQLGEIFVKADKVGTLTSGALDAVALMMSIGLQHGIPIESLATKLVSMRFEPMGATGDPDFPLVSSILDYMGRWLLKRFPSKPAAETDDSPPSLGSNMPCAASPPAKSPNSPEKCVPRDPRPSVRRPREDSEYQPDGQDAAVLALSPQPSAKPPSTPKKRVSRGPRPSVHPLREDSEYQPKKRVSHGPRPSVRRLRD